MADEASTEGTSSSQVTSESSESAIEINIKTLDSQIYTFRVKKDMPVPTLKAKLVNVTGLPVERQRLIFRGKVLKDEHLLSEYHLEDGHTLHLVARQPVQGQPSPGTGSEATAQDNNNQGNDSTAGAPRNRVGQVSHSVVLGTANIADQGESMIADIGRLVGTVLSSLGVGNLIPTGTVSNTSSATISNPVPSSVEAEGTQNARAPPGFTILNHPFQSLNQIPQFPSTGTLSRHMVIPDSLATLSEFIRRMELALQNDGSQSSPSTSVRDPPQSEIPSLNVRGLPTPEMLGSVMEQVQQLFRGDAAAALSRVATRLEREGTSTDPVVRGQIQAEAMHVGVTMQHLGAMLLELGRTIMTLRMGQSPAESSVNAGPAVYISPAGPNPIMVQPYPLQTNSLFGVSSPPLVSGVSGPFTTGDPSRNINIHIHAGSSVAPGVSFAATRANSGEAVRGERRNAEQASRNDNGSGDSVPARELPSRTVVAAIPARPTAETASHVLNVIYPVHMRSQPAVPIHSASAQSSHPTVSSGMQTNAPILVPQPSSESGTFPTLVAQISAQVASALGGNAQGLSLSSHSMQSIDTQGPRPTTGCEAQPDMVSSSAQIPSVADTSSMLETQINAINAQLPSALSSNAQGQSLSPSVQCTDTSCTKGPELVPPGLMSSGLGENDVNGHAGNVADAEDSGSSASIKPHVPHISMPESGQQLQPEGLHNPNDRDSRGSSVMEEDLSTTTSTGGSTVCQPSHTLPDQTETKSSEKNLDSVATVHASQSSQGSGSDRITPLGLGLGSLQPKRRGKLAKPVGKDKVSCDTPSSNQNQQSVAKGQQFLHSLASHSSDMNRVNANGSSNPPSSIIGQIMDGMPLGGQGGSGQVGAADMMSQILQSPAFNSLLTGVAAHTGIGSSADLRGMLEQCTRSPAVRNTLNEIAQQVEGQPQDIGAMLSGFGRGQGGIDFSRMFQQMMPAMSQALGRGSTRSAPRPGLEPADQPQCSGGKTGGDDMLHIRNSQIDLQQAVERIEQHDAPGDVFRAVLESAGHLYGEGNSFEDLVDELADNADLRDEFVGMFCRDLRRRMQTDSIAED